MIAQAQTRKYLLLGASYHSFKKIKNNYDEK